MKIIISLDGNVQISKNGIIDAKVVEFKNSKCLLVNDGDEVLGDEFKVIRKIDDNFYTYDISEEKADTLEILDDSEFTLEKFMYVVTEENTYDIKEDLKKAGAKWNSVFKVWYFEKENFDFKNEKVYII